MFADNTPNFSNFQKQLEMGKSCKRRKWIKHSQFVFVLSVPMRYICKDQFLFYSQRNVHEILTHHTIYGTSKLMSQKNQKFGIIGVFFSFHISLRFHLSSHPRFRNGQTKLFSIHRLLMRPVKTMQKPLLF